MLNRLPRTVEVKMVSTCYNPDVAVPLDRIEMLVISAEKNERVYLGKGDCLIQGFQAGGGWGVGPPMMDDE